MAARKGHVKIVEYLINAGANSDIHNKVSNLSSLHNELLNNDVKIFMLSQITDHCTVGIKKLNIL